MNIMNLENFLHWFMSHNTLIIEALILLTLLSVGFILVYSIFRKDSHLEAAGAGVTSVDFEKTLRKVLDESASKPDAKTVASLIQDEEETDEAVASSAEKVAEKPPTPDPAITQELETAKKEIQAKEEMVLELKKQLEETQQTMNEVREKAESAAQNMQEASSPVSEGEVVELTKKIKELETKLQEYEVIEDDIANLSLYKSENNQLKKELFALKDRFKPKAEESGEASSLVGEFAAAIGAKPPTVSPLKKEVKPAEAAPAPEATASEVKVEAEPPVADVQVSSEEKESAPTMSTQTAAEPKVTNTDIPEKTVSKADEVLGEINIEAIAQEMDKQTEQASQTGEIAKTDPTDSFETLGAVSTPEQASANANLDDVFGQVDPDKLLAETAEMTQSAPPAAAEEEKATEDEEVGQKLIDEFESFMKSG